jgi:hypothetical protein
MKSGNGARAAIYCRVSTSEQHADMQVATETNLPKSTVAFLLRPASVEAV